jgi:hypothetical protein
MQHCPVKSASLCVKYLDCGIVAACRDFTGIRRQSGNKPVTMRFESVVVSMNILVYLALATEAVPPVNGFVKAHRLEDGSTDSWWHRWLSMVA